MFPISLITPPLITSHQQSTPSTTPKRTPPQNQTTNKREKYNTMQINLHPHSGQSSQSSINFIYVFSIRIACAALKCGPCPVSRDTAVETTDPRLCSWWVFPSRFIDIIIADWASRRAYGHPGRIGNLLCLLRGAQPLVLRIALIARPAGLTKFIVPTILVDGDHV